MADGSNFHSTFLNDWLRFAGFTELRHQPTG
jgi:hypothetical protein